MPRPTLDETLEFITARQSNNHRYPYNMTVPDGVGNACDWIMSESRLPWLEIKGFNPPYKEMLAEAQSLRHRFVSHRDSQGQGWKSLCVHGVSAEQTNPARHYGLEESQDQYQWTEIKDQCPATVEFFRDCFHFRSYTRVRFMLLEPGGFIGPHQDTNSYMVSTAVNISLNNPQGCGLVNEYGAVPFRDSGSIFMFNTSYEHAAANLSDQDRFHVIVHGAHDMRHWSKIIVDSFNQKHV